MTKAHHHGDLREALILAGIELLNDGGLDALTLRKCAAKAGVSHAAPAHHFSGLKGLVQAIAQRGMSMFAKAMQDEIDLVLDKPFDKLHAMCKGYLAFHQHNRALANLMFNQSDDNISPSVEGRSSSPAFQILVNTCAPFKHSNAGPLATQYAIWSLIQGYVQLQHLGQMKQPADGSVVTFKDLLTTLNLQLIDDDK